MKRLVEDWWAARDSGSSAMIALRRADVRELNTQARERMRAAGNLGSDVALPCGTFALGDRVVLRRNDRRLGISNGMLATVRSIGPAGAMNVDTAGREVRLPSRYLDSPEHRPAVQHAYAITGHVAQGITVDHAFVLGGPEIYREWGYTVMSRGRHGNKLYVVAPEDLERREIAPREQEVPTALESLVRGMTTSRAQTAAIDAGQAQRIRSASTRELRRRAATLGLDRTGPDLAAALIDYETLTARLERMLGKLRSAEQQLASMTRRRPTRLRPRARLRHRQNQRRLQANLGRRLAALHAITAERERAARNLDTARVEAVRAASSRVSELALIRDELERRTARERAAGWSAAVERSAARDSQHSFDPSAGQRRVGSAGRPISARRPRRRAWSRSTMSRPMA